MAYFRQEGSLPDKRRTLFDNGKGGFYAEELVGEEGFVSDLSHVYHLNPPTAVIKAEAVEVPVPEEIENWPMIPRHFRTQNLPVTDDLILGRTTLMSNSDVTIGFATGTSPSELYRNANGAELVFVHDGGGTLRSMFGDLEVRKDDYVVIPAGVTHQWVPGTDGFKLLAIESRGHIKAPKRYLSEAGQFLEMAPYRERDLRVPVFTGIAEEGEVDILIRRGKRFTRMSFRHHPFDVVGWDGCVYPYALSVHSLEPIVGRIHQPPPVHQTFEAPGFVVCSFVPRLSDYDPAAVGGPANHMNIDSDEVMFYTGGDYASRSGSGIDLGSISLHPLGWVHGPQKQPDGKRKPGVMLDEVAVMVDTFQPLSMSQQALDVEAPEYHTTWDRALGGIDANR